MASIFVDESGNLGVSNGRYFVIAVVAPQNKKRLDNIVKHHCAANGLVEIKATLLTFPAKQDLLRKIASADDHSIYYVVADKRHIQSPLFRDKNVLFNYLFQWAVKPLIKNSSGTLDIFVDNHTTKVTSRNSLTDYIRAKAYAEWGVSTQINLHYVDSKACRAIQVADLAANTIYGRYIHNKEHLYNLLKIGRSAKFPNGKFNT